MKLDNCRVYRIETEDSGRQQKSTVRFVHDSGGPDAELVSLVFTRRADVEQFAIGKRVSITIE